MFDEFKNLDFDTYSDSELLALIRQTLPTVTLHLQATQELVNRHDNHSDQTTSSEGDGNSQYTFIANGHELAMQQLSDINKDDFDVIMDTTTNSLRFRKNPVRHSKLEQSELKKVGSHRMKILAYMLEHPGKPFHAGNIGSDLVAGSGERARNTFTKSIAVIRKALDQGNMSEPYLVKRFDWDGITGLKQGCVYKINSERKYLVIRHKKNSEQIPL